MESLSTSSEKPSWVTTHSPGVPCSQEPLSLGLTMRCVSPFSSRPSHHARLAFSFS